MKTAPTTAQLQKELEELLLWFESEKVDLDEAVSKYKRGTELIKELETRLQQAENTIIKLAKN